MSGWVIAAWALACGAGVIVFLATVARTIEFGEHELRCFEAHERRARQARERAAADAARAAEKAA